jgi:hypothetical protein
MPRGTPSPKISITMHPDVHARALIAADRNEREFWADHPAVACPRSSSMSWTLTSSSSPVGYGRGVSSLPTLTTSSTCQVTPTPVYRSAASEARSRSAAGAGQWKLMAFRRISSRLKREVGPSRPRRSTSRAKETPQTCSPWNAVTASSPSLLRHCGRDDFGQAATGSLTSARSSTDARRSATVGAGCTVINSSTPTASANVSRYSFTMPAVPAAV